MEIEIMPDAQKDLDFWIKTGDKSVLKKIAQLIEDILDKSIRRDW